MEKFEITIVISPRRQGLKGTRKMFEIMSVESMTNFRVTVFSLHFLADFKGPKRKLKIMKDRNNEYSR